MVKLTGTLVDAAIVLLGLYLNQKRAKDAAETALHEVNTEAAKVDLLSTKADIVVAATNMRAKNEAAAGTPMTPEEKKTDASDALNAIARPDASVALKDAAIEASVKKQG